MYFTWKNTPYGLIKISEDGFRNFLNQLLNPVLNPYFIIHSLSLETEISSENDDAKLILVMYPHENPEFYENVHENYKQKIEEYLSLIFRPMGIIISVVWVEPEKNFFELMLNPWLWSLIASSVSIIFTSGGDNFFWTAFWGASAWFASKIVQKLSNSNIIINHNEID